MVIVIMFLVIVIQTAYSYSQFRSKDLCFKINGGATC